MNKDTLQALLDYNENTGIFTWKVDRQCIRAGQRAGTKHHSGYWNIKVCGKSYSAHRLAWLYMTGSFPDHDINHKDLNKQNNAWDNLEPTTDLLNQKNRPMNSNNTSGFCGVWWEKKPRKWRAQIVVNKKKIHLGLFRTMEEAIAARLAAESLYGFSSIHGKVTNDTNSI